MDSQKVDMFLMTNGKYFDQDQLPYIKARLKEVDENRWDSIQFLQFKDPTTSLIISVIIGELGIDRFYIGDVGLGIAKLLTCGGFFIWYIVDWFLIMGSTRDRNLAKLNEVLG